MAIPKKPMIRPDGDGLNNVSLRDYIESRLDAMAVAVDVAKSSMERRLDSMNEFRGQLKDQTSTFLPRSESDATHERISQDIRELREGWKAAEKAIAAGQREFAAAKEELDTRLKGMNEFRESLNDIVSRCVTRAEWVANHDRVKDDIQEARSSIKDHSALCVTREEYRLGHSKLESDITMLREFRAELTGKASQSSVILAFIVSALGLLIGLAGLVIQFAHAGGRTMP